MQKQLSMTKLGEYLRRRERSNSQTHYQSGRARDGPVFLCREAVQIDGRTILSFVPSSQKPKVCIKGCNTNFDNDRSTFTYIITRKVTSPSHTFSSGQVHILARCLVLTLRILPQHFVLRPQKHRLLKSMNEYQGATV